MKTTETGKRMQQGEERKKKKIDQQIDKKLERLSHSSLRPYLLNSSIFIQLMCCSCISILFFLLLLMYTIHIYPHLKLNQHLIHVFFFIEKQFPNARLNSSGWTLEEVLSWLAKKKQIRRWSIKMDAHQNRKKKWKIEVISVET